MDPIGRLIERYLEIPGASQTELARQSGVPLTTINRFVGDKDAGCTMKTYEALARVINAALAFEKE